MLLSRLSRALDICSAFWYAYAIRGGRPASSSFSSPIWTPCACSCSHFLYSSKVWAWSARGTVNWRWNRFLTTSTCLVLTCHRGSESVGINKQENKIRQHHIETFAALSHSISSRSGLGWKLRADWFAVLIKRRLKVLERDKGTSTSTLASAMLSNRADS